MTQTRLIIFDCDGVLVDSEPLVNRVCAEMLGELGFSVDRDALLEEFVGVAMTTRVQALRKRFPWNPSPEFLPAFHQRLRELVTRELRPVAGVTEVLQNLAVPFCVASNGNPEEVRFRLDAAGLADLVRTRIFSAVEVPSPKPAPDLFLYAAKTMGVAPGDCTVVEDSIPGIQAAVAAKMRVFGYAAHTGLRRVEEAGAIAFTSMSLLPSLLEAQNRE